MIAVAGAVNLQAGKFSQGENQVAGQKDYVGRENASIGQSCRWKHMHRGQHSRSKQPSSKLMRALGGEVCRNVERSVFQT
jgi:hypothetical protein